MKKMLYISHVSWGWIKQRPHFLAEHLSDFYEIDFMYEKSYHKNSLVKSQPNNKLKLIESLRFPLNRFPFVKRLNVFLFNLYVNTFVKIKNYDVIWLTYPLDIQDIKEIRKKSTVVYDCMDDILSFPNLSSPQIQVLLEREKSLCEVSRHIFVSSNNLKNKLIQRHSLEEKKVILVENGVSSALLSNKFDIDINQERKDRIKIVYIGTISEWMDFTLLENSLKVHDNIEYLFFGPREVVVPSNDRLTYGGILEHKDVFRTMKEADILIMPFILNELILSVDPVKMYEYILAYKPILAIRYPETEKFSSYSYLYDDQEDFNNNISLIVENNFKVKEPFESHYTFVEKSTWNERINIIIGAIDNVK